MKIAKRFAAGLLAAALTVTMAIPAFAAVTNTTVWSLKGTYEVTGEGATAPKENITFTVTPKSWPGAVREESVPIPTITGGEIGDISETKSDYTYTVGNLDKYTRVGDYVYTVTQNVTGTPQAGVDHQDTFYMKVQVYGVLDDGNFLTDDMQVSVVFSEDATNFNKNQDDSYGPKLANITNTYTAGGLTVTKKVAGYGGDREQEFAFTVTFTNTDSTKAFDNAIKVSGDSSDSVEQEGNTYTFTLKHGQSVSFTNVPKGIAYTVTETPADEYTTKIYNSSTFTVLNRGDEIGEKGSVSGTIAGGDAQGVTYVNSRDFTPDTGVILDNAPYIVMIGIVAVVAIVLIVKKKKRDEE